MRQDFFPARSFRGLDDFNVQLRRWLDEVANARVHASTKIVVAEAFADQRPTLLPLPAVPYATVLRFERRVSHEGTVSQYSRLVDDWVALAGLDPAAYGTHSLRRTEVALVCRRTRNLRACLLLLGHTKLESTVRYLGIEVDDALALSEQTDL